MTSHCASFASTGRARLVLGDRRAGFALEGVSVPQSGADEALVRAAGDVFRRAWCDQLSPAGRPSESVQERTRAS